MDNKVLAVVAGVEITQNDLEEIIMRYPEDKRGYFNNSTICSSSSTTKTFPSAIYPSSATKNIYKYIC